MRISRLLLLFGIFAFLAALATAGADGIVETSVEPAPSSDVVAGPAHPSIGAGGSSGSNSNSGSAPSCVSYEAGWYVTDSASLYGGHMGITPQNMPPPTTGYCSGGGMGFTNGVSFGTNSWIQAGLAIFPGETRARWFCQSNDNGDTTTRYGPSNAYANGDTVYTWFARDNFGTWRTYRYDSGPNSIELPCKIRRGASGNLQIYGEIQQASSTSANMGPWTVSDLRYQSTSGQWYVPNQLQASYPYGTPCPPYGAGTVTGGAIMIGSGKPCSTGTKPYPN